MKQRIDSILIAVFICAIVVTLVAHVNEDKKMFIAMQSTILNQDDAMSTLVHEVEQLKIDNEELKAKVADEEKDFADWRGLFKSMFPK